MQTITVPERRAMTHADQHRTLATMIAQALSLADTLDLARVGISLNDALEQLTGHGYAPTGTEPPVNAA